MRHGRLVTGVIVATGAFVGSGHDAAAKPPRLPNLVRHGSFERPRVPPGSSHSFPSIPGWRLAFGPSIEIQNRVAGDPAVGDQLVELDSDASSGIYQRVPTRAGRLYRLQFAFSPRPGTAADQTVLVVKWHRQVVARISASGRGLRDTDWRSYAFKVRATRPSTRLEFDDGGISDSVGTHLDGVVVIRWRGHPTGVR